MAPSNSTPELFDFLNLYLAERDAGEDRDRPAPPSDGDAPATQARQVPEIVRPTLLPR